MINNEITITLDDVLGPDGLEGAWDAMVRKLTDRAESKLLHSDVGRSFHAVAVDAINSAVADKISSAICEMMARPIQKTDSYGNPVGEPATFDGMIGEAVEKAMETTVDLYGKPKPGKSNGMHDLTLFQYSLQRVALKGLTEAVTTEAKKVNTEAKEAVSKELAKAIAKTLR